MIKIGDRVVFVEDFIASFETVEDVINTDIGAFYKLKGMSNPIQETENIKILPEKKDGLYVTVGCDPELIKGVRDTISEAVCELQEYATNEHSYYTADGKEMLSTWKQKGDHVYDVHTFEKVSPSNWKQLS